MPDDLSGPVYVDVLVWDGWDTMAARVDANRTLSFNITE